MLRSKEGTALNKTNTTLTGPRSVPAWLVISLIVVGCGAPEVAPGPTGPAGPADETAVAATSPQASAPVGLALAGDPQRGGQLYDTWWAVTEAEAPTTDHPLWATQSTNTRGGADTWRCKECHGWDYKGADGAYGSGSHLTGFTGVLASAAKPAEEILAAMNGGTNADHDFSAVMGEQELADLSQFVTQSLIDDKALIDDKKASTGNPADGRTRYEETCASCHGPGGNAINFGSIGEPEFLGHVAPDNPWEFVHKVRFGQPGWPMPSAIANDWAESDVADVLAYAQTLDTEPAVSGGAQLYDTWWAVTGAAAPTTEQPLWATQTTNTRGGEETWRCKECHGWDYKGADGAYGSGSHLTGFTGVLGAASLTPDAILAWLDGRTNAKHDFSTVMVPAELNALATFVQKETADVTSLVGADGKSVGDPVVGREIFDGTCAACHGKDGKKRNFGDDKEPEYVGTIAVDNPPEFLHKAQFGQPGEPMPAGKALGWTSQDLADLLAYAQTLPTE